MITLADKKRSEKARRYSVEGLTPKKHQTPIQTNNNFDGTKLILRVHLYRESYRFCRKI